MQKLTEHNLFPKIGTFPGLVLGISAGAYVLTKEYIDIDPVPATIMPASNLININIKCHYAPAMDTRLIPLSKTRTIYAIPDNAALIYNDDLSAIGQITKFEHNKKIDLW